jgi:hypothetical protein
MTKALSGLESFDRAVIAGDCWSYVTSNGQLLSSKNYRVRCAAAETVSTLADKRNRQTIVEALQNSLHDEPTFAARYAVQRSVEVDPAQARRREARAKRSTL